MGRAYKNQHYIPQTYLRRFATDGNYIDVWNIKKNCIMPHQNARNFAAVRNFYDTDSPALREALAEIEQYHRIDLSTCSAERSHFVENGLGKSESDIDEVLSQISENQCMLYDETNQHKLIVFLHDLAYRTEGFRSQSDDIYQQTTDALSEMGIDPKAVKNLHTGQEVQTYQLVGVRPILETAIMLLDRYSWYLATTASNLKLVVSDDPAAYIRHGFNDICFPISATQAVIFRIKENDAPMISADMPVDGQVALSDASVLRYNLLQLASAHRFVFGDTSTLQILKGGSPNPPGGFK